MKTLGFRKSDMSNVPNASKFVIETNLPRVFDMTSECNKVIDQGNRGICVSVSMNDTLKTNLKRMNKKFNKELDYYYINRERQDIDGMTVKEAMEMAREDGDIKLYAQVQDIETMKNSIFNNGACPIGLPVYNYNDNFWKKDGKLIGGHCVVLVGWTKNSFILKNSWGKSWANNGFTYFPFDDWNCRYEAWTIIK